MCILWNALNGIQRKDLHNLFLQMVHAFAGLPESFVRQMAILQDAHAVK